MTKFGVHSLVFTDEWNETNARKACDTAARIGYDLIEVLIFDPSGLDVELTRKVIKDAGLELRLGMALGPQSDVSSGKSEIAQSGIADVNRCLEIASDLGAPGVSGITYAAFNVYDAPQTEAQYAQVVETFREFDKRAGELGVRLGIEPVNRYESYMIQTLDQAAQLIRDCGGKNLFAHMDTFHMNIEEPDVSSAIARTADFLGYAHVAESNRALLGGGNFDFAAYFRALAAANYSGDFTVETFSPAVLSPDIVGAVSLWRQQWADSEAAASSALDFMRSQWQTAQAAVSPW
ncbi:MAG: sugar phosphate isomerase/epimerase family protein [Rhizobiaceae bacterium]